MTLRLSGLAIGVLIFLVGPSVQASPRLIVPGDSSGDAVRRAADEFLSKLVAGDAAGAKAAFAGTGDESELLDASLRLVPVGADLEKAMSSLPDANPQLIAFLPHRALLEGRRDAVSHVHIIESGDVACVASAGIGTPGLRLKRADGRWTVTHLTNSAEFTRRTIRFINGYIETAKGIVRRIGSREVGDSNSALQPLAEFMRQSIFQIVAPLSGSPTELGPVPPDRHFAYSTADVRGLFGTTLNSDEIRHFIASCSGLPELGEYPDSFQLDAKEEGISLMFHGPGRTLSKAVLYSGSNHAFWPFAAALPNGIAFGEQRAAVESSIGRPTLSSGGKRTNYAATYPRLGLSVIYEALSAMDPHNAVDQLVLLPIDAKDVGARAVTTPRLQFRLVSDKAAPAAETEVLTDPYTNRPLSVSREVLLDEAAVEDVLPTTTGEGRPGVGLTMTEAGGKRLAAITVANVGHRLVIVLDGRVLIAPVIKGVMSRGVLIEPGGASGDAAVSELAERLHAAMTSLPPVHDEKGASR